MRLLLAGLLTADPDSRGGADFVRAAPWFAAGAPGAVNWDKLCAVMTDEVPVPAEARAALDAALAAPPHVDDVQGVAAYAGDRAWFAEF